MSPWHFLQHRYWQRRGQRWLNQGRASAAYACFQRALLLQNEPEDRFHVGLALLGLGRYNEARGFIEDLAGGEQAPEVALLALAECSLMQRRWEEAEGLFAKLCDIRPGSRRYTDWLALARDGVRREKHVIVREYFNRAQALLEKKQPKEALQSLEEAWAADNTNALVANNIGSLLLLRGRTPAEACFYFEKAVTLEPDNVRFRENLSWVRRKVKL